MQIGYARVSTDDQDTAAQVAATYLRSWSGLGSPQRVFVVNRSHRHPMMQMVGAFAEFERAMLKERTKAGLDAAREEGRVGGRRPKLSDQQQSEIRKMITKGDKTAADAARLFKVHPATISQLLARPSSRKVSRAK